MFQIGDIVQYKNKAAHIFSDAKEIFVVRNTEQIRNPLNDQYSQLVHIELVSHYRSSYIWREYSKNLELYKPIKRNLPEWW